ncbi:hypothetical protein FJT64_008571 [Amphibalanus amphitrite]|uniref:Uncharacterized protein n=1 Tax=Amphibalanus amphitrite TaxID=1232801 RepID=A0A6A4VGZ6_AMPAM|nr:hypothetical protein FJT64_008571 [Amphibalanus amphitrite]
MATLVRAIRYTRDTKTVPTPTADSPPAAAALTADGSPDAAALTAAALTADGSPAAAALTAAALTADGSPAAAALTAAALTADGSPAAAALTAAALTADGSPAALTAAALTVDNRTTEGDSTVTPPRAEIPADPEHHVHAERPLLHHQRFKRGTMAVGASTVTLPMPLHFRSSPLIVVTRTTRRLHCAQNGA